MGIRIALAMIAALCVSMAVRAAEPQKVTDVWLDVDTATGIGDVDDGLMLIQSFHSPEVRIRGISVVFGNAPLKLALPIARDIAARFGPPGMVPLPGAASAGDFGKETPAVKAMAAELERGPMTIVAAGPVTNVGTLLKLYPRLDGRIERIVMVAGRRPNQRFVTSQVQKTPHRDFNFELDPAAMRAILDAQIPLVLAPWEVSSQVWISREDLEVLRKSGGSGAWIAHTSQYWIDRWEKSIDARGFNPFDTLAMGWLTHPELIKTEEMAVTIEEAPDDRALLGRPAKTKPYLVVRPASAQARRALYCFMPKPGFKELLIGRLGESPP
ncbi:MAG: nucleoside hydrolase [Pirellulales bacterium]